MKQELCSDESTNSKKIMLPNLIESFPNRAINNADCKLNIKWKIHSHLLKREEIAIAILVKVIALSSMF